MIHYSEATVPVKPRIDFEGALATAEPLVSLHQSVKEELAHGVPRDEVFGALTDELRLLRASGRDDDEEVVASVMEFMEGWGSPRWHL